MTRSEPAGLPRFHHFAAIDWSGAAGERHKGIAVGLCMEGRSAPALVRPGHRWSRGEVLQWLLEDMPADTLAGMDLGLSLAFADTGAFFPGWAESPADARSLWALVDRLCETDPHLAVTGFVDHVEAARHFRRHGAREGDLFATNGKRGGRGRFRQTELAQAEQGCKPYSNFNLVGAAQVGKSSLTGMRLLHRLDGRLPVWPVDPLPASGSVLARSTPPSPRWRRAALPPARRCAASRSSTPPWPPWAAIPFRAPARSTTIPATPCSPPPGCASRRIGRSCGAPRA